jgi:hypothetical protein
LAMTALKGCPSSLVIPSLIVPAHAATNMQAAATAARRCTVISRVSQQGRRRWPRRLLRCCRDRPYPRSGDTAPLDMGKTSAADEPTRVNWRRRSPSNRIETTRFFDGFPRHPQAHPHSGIGSIRTAKDIFSELFRASASGPTGPMARCYTVSIGRPLPDLSRCEVGAAAGRLDRGHRVQ